MHFDLDAMAMTPPFVMEAYTPPEALWRLVEENVAPGEQQEIRDILGNSMVEQSLELRNEVKCRNSSRRLKIIHRTSFVQNPPPEYCS